MTQYSLINRIGLGTLITLLLFTLIPEQVLNTQSVDSVRAQTGFSVYMCLIVFSTVMMKGQNNIRFVYIFMFVSILEIWLFLQLNRLLMDTSLYIRMWIGTAISLLSYYIISRANVFLMVTYIQMMKLPCINSYALKKLSDLAPTRFNLQLATVMKYYFVFEVLVALYCLSYSLTMGIPLNGSMYQTIVTHGHIDYLPFYITGMDLLLVLTIFVFGKTIIEEWQDQPDMLFKET